MPASINFSSNNWVYEVGRLKLYQKTLVNICWKQARNQLGTPGAKSFLRGALIFWTMSNSFKPCPTHFSSRGEIFSRGDSLPLRPPWLQTWLKALNLKMSRNSSSD